MKNFWDSASIETRADLYSHTQQGAYADLVAPLPWRDLTLQEQDALCRVVWLGVAERKL